MECGAVVCQSQIFLYDDFPIEGDGLLEFRLLYSGRILGASRTDTRATLKHEIRREFHPQLRRLWKINESLRELTKHSGYIYDSSHREKHDRPDYRLENLNQPLGYVDDDGDIFYRDLGADVIPDDISANGFGGFSAGCGRGLWGLGRADEMGVG
jgi:hypothetical protein